VIRNICMLYHLYKSLMLSMLNFVLEFNIIYCIIITLFSVLNYIISYYTILYYIILYYILLYYIILYYITLHYIIL